MSLLSKEKNRLRPILSVVCWLRRNWPSPWHSNQTSLLLCSRLRPILSVVCCLLSVVCIKAQGGFEWKYQRLGIGMPQDYEVKQFTDSLVVLQADSFQVQVQVLNRRQVSDAQLGQRLVQLVQSNDLDIANLHGSLLTAPNVAGAMCFAPKNSGNKGQIMLASVVSHVSTQAFVILIETLPGAEHMADEIMHSFYPSYPSYIFEGDLEGNPARLTEFPDQAWADKNLFFAYEFNGEPYYTLMLYSPGYTDPTPVFTLNTNTGTVHYYTYDTQALGEDMVEFQNTEHDFLPQFKIEWDDNRDWMTNYTPYIYKHVDMDGDKWMQANGCVLLSAPLMTDRFLEHFMDDRMPIYQQLRQARDAWLTDEDAFAAQATAGEDIYVELIKFVEANPLRNPSGQLSDYEKARQETRKEILAVKK